MEWDFRCDTCGKQLTTICCLIAHLKSTHAASFKCVTCDYQLNITCHLIAHLLMHDFPRIPKVDRKLNPDTFGPLKPILIYYWIWPPLHLWLHVTVYIVWGVSIYWVVCLCTSLFWTNEFLSKPFKYLY